LPIVWLKLKDTESHVVPTPKLLDLQAPTLTYS